MCIRDRKYTDFSELTTPMINEFIEKIIVYALSLIHIFGKYGRMRRSYLKEHRPILYTNLLASGMLHRHLAEIDQACNERMAIIVSDMARQEDVTEALKAADQMEWVRRMNSIRNRAEEIVLTELVYE